MRLIILPGKTPEEEEGFLSRKKLKVPNLPREEDFSLKLRETRVIANYATNQRAGWRRRESGSLAKT